MVEITPEKRRKIMSSIPPKDTSPEMAVRRFVHSKGYRYRIHVTDLPGRPDMVFPRRKKIILVHGCFWHQHPGCRLARLPKRNQEYWIPKLNRNRERDLAVQEKLQTLGWNVLIVWECETEGMSQVKEKIIDFLG